MEHREELFIKDEQAVQEAENWFTQKIFNEITEEFYQRGSFSVYIIHASADGKLYEGVGFSKARPEVSAAKYDAELGKKVAKGRSIHDLFSEYRKTKK